MNYGFAVFMVFAAMVGGGYLLKLSNDNFDAAAAGYGVLAIAWVVGCLVFAAKVV